MACTEFFNDNNCYIKKVKRHCIISFLKNRQVLLPHPVFVGCREMQCKIVVLMFDEEILSK
jgi:hypothetical protein